MKMIFAALTFSLTCFFTVSASATQLKQKMKADHTELISLVCSADDSTCQNLCQNASECPLAGNSCDGCASAEDLSLISIFKDVDTVYTKSDKPVDFDSFKKWMTGPSQKIFIDSNSNLDIYTAPNNEEKKKSWADKLNQICGSVGEHRIMADVSDAVRPAVLICVNNSSPVFYKMKYRPDYTSDVLKNDIQEIQLKSLMINPASLINGMK